MMRAIAHMQGWLAKRGAEELAEITAPFFPQIERNILVSSLRRYAEAGIWALPLTFPGRVRAAR